MYWQQKNVIICTDWSDFETWTKKKNQIYKNGHQQKTKTWIALATSLLAELKEMKYSNLEKYIFLVASLDTWNLEHFLVASLDT